MATATPVKPNPTSVSMPSLLAATRATPETKTLDLQQAVDFYQKGTEQAHNATGLDEIVRAIELFSIAIAIRNDQARFFFARGNAFRAINELEFAAKDYSLAISLDDRTAAYFASRGACHRKLNQPAKALEDLTAAIDMDGKKANHYFNRALVLYDNGFFREAAIDITKTLDEGSAGIRAEYKALQMRGNCHRRLGNLQKCIDDLQRAIQLDGRNPTGFCSLAQAFLETGDLDQAIEHFSNAIQLNNLQASYFALRGLCYFRKCGGGNAEGSGTIGNVASQNARMCLADFNQAIKLDGKDPQAYFYRGSIRLALALDLLRNMEAARSSVKWSLAVGEDAPTGSMSTSLNAEEQLEASFADIEMAWNLCPLGLKFQVGMAMITQLQQQYERASTLFRELHMTDQMSVIVKFHWALCCHMLHRMEPALDLLCDCIDVVPTEPMFFEARALALHEAGHHDLAIGDFTEAIFLRGETDPYLNAWNLYLRADCHLRLHHYEASIRDASSVIESYDVSAHDLPSQLVTSVHNTRALAFRGMGQYDLAVEDLTECVRLTPSSGILLYNRALCLLECDRFAEALPDLLGTVSASDTDGNDAFLLYSIGLCYYRQHQTRECIEYMERAEKLRRTLTIQEQTEVLPDLYYRMGVAHALENRNMRAVECFTSAIDSCQTSNTASLSCYVHERAKALQLEGYYEESIEDFTFVIDHNPNNAHAYFRRGFAFKSLGKLSEAAFDFETAKGLDPKNPQLVVKYNALKDTECIVVCPPGQEPSF